MDASTQLRQLAQCLAGVFQNRQQALAEPTWFVHLRLWSYPVLLFEDSFTFFIEQASAAYAQPPYRQRVLRLRSQSGQLTAEYYALSDPQQFQGAAQAPAKLQALSQDDLQPLVASSLKVDRTATSDETRYVARQYAGERCQFTLEGSTKYVELGFDAICAQASRSTADAFWMYDKGIDTTTGKATWGALHGPFQLQKVEDFSPVLTRVNPS
ncbi:MAG: chromophore lyase CpcT/CpeT [Cyanobacteria bacterium P01_H01_bin.58]